MHDKDVKLSHPMGSLNELQIDGPHIRSTYYWSHHKRQAFLTQLPCSSSFGIMLSGVCANLEDRDACDPQCHFLRPVGQLGLVGLGSIGPNKVTLVSRDGYAQ